MKKTLKSVALIMCAVTLFAFAGCGKQKIDTSSSSEENTVPVGKIVGEWKVPVNESKKINLYLSFDNDGKYNRYIDFDGERILLNGGDYKYYVFGGADSERGTFNIENNKGTEYYPGITVRTEIAGYWLTMTKSDMMISGERAYAESADVIISEKLDQEGINSLKAGDIITFSLIDDKVDGTLMANTHMISKVYDNGGSKEFLIEYPYEFYGKKSDKVSADRVLGKFVGKITPENKAGSMEYYYEINDGELKLWQLYYDYVDAYERG